MIWYSHIWEIGVMSLLSRDQQIQVIGCLTEGMSIRAIERLTGIHRDTIMRLGARVGRGCAELARPHHGWLASRPCGNGRTVGVRRQETAPSETHGQPGEGRPIHVRCLGLIVPRDHGLSHRQAAGRHDGPIRSRLARARDRIAGNQHGRIHAVSTGDPRRIPEQRTRRYQQDFQRHAFGPHGSGAPSLFARSGHRGCEGSGARRAGANQHVLCRAQQSFDPHGHRGALRD